MVDPCISLGSGRFCSQSRIPSSKNLFVSSKATWCELELPSLLSPSSRQGKEKINTTNNYHAGAPIVFSTRLIHQNKRLTPRSHPIWCEVSKENYFSSFYLARHENFKHLANLHRMMLIDFASTLMNPSYFYFVHQTISG